jgi:SOS-response transcriptional repressor LexA
MTTTRQADTYRAILNFKRLHDGNSPTVRELGTMLGLFSTSSVHLHLHALAKAGLITCDFPAARSIQVTGALWTPPLERTDPDNQHAHRRHNQRRRRHRAVARLQLRARPQAVV